MRIGFASQNPTSHYWLLVGYGAHEGAAELGIDIVTSHARTLEQQIAAINIFIDQRVDLILLGPVAAIGLADTIARAQTLRIPVIVLAAQLNDCTVHCTVRSDHGHGAELAAAYMVEQIGAEGEVAHLIGPSVLQDNIDRAAGVRKVLGRHPKVRIVFEQESPNWMSASGAAMMSQALERYPNIRGVCVANDTIALGAIKAIEAAGRTGQIVVTGFDAVPDALVAIHEGRMSATVRRWHGASRPGRRCRRSCSPISRS
jgi:ribose transport system substrate-binding protein